MSVHFSLPTQWWCRWMGPHRDSHVFPTTLTVSPSFLKSNTTIWSLTSHLYLSGSLQHPVLVKAKVQTTKCMTVPRIFEQNGCRFMTPNDQDNGNTPLLLQKFNGFITAVVANINFILRKALADETYLFTSKLLKFKCCFWLYDEKNDPSSAEMLLY